jgi:hypothetical protein
MKFTKKLLFSEIAVNVLTNFINLNVTFKFNYYFNVY